MTAADFDAGMKRLGLAFNAKFDGETGRKKYNLYFERLKHIPVGAWDKAVDACLDECAYFPKIKELKSAARSEGVQHEDSAPMSLEDQHQCWPVFEDYERFFRSRGLWDPNVTLDQHRKIWDDKHRPYNVTMLKENAPEIFERLQDLKGLGLTSMAAMKQAANQPPRTSPREPDDRDDIPF